MIKIITAQDHCSLPIIEGDFELLVGFFAELVIELLSLLGLVVILLLLLSLFLLLRLDLSLH